MPSNYRRVGRIDAARNTFGDEEPAQPYRTPNELLESRAAKNWAVDQVRLRDEYDSQAAYDELVGRGSIVAVHRVGRVNALAQATPPVVIVRYDVPENYLFKFDKFGFQFSNPVLHQLDPVTYLPMLVRIDAQPVGGLAERDTISYYVCPGSIYRPVEFGPIWCIGGAAITVEVNTLAAVTIYCCAMALIGGELVQRSGLKLGRAV